MNAFKKTLIALTLGLTAASAQAAGEAKNVIFFLGDGMGPVDVTASRIYKYGEAGMLNMEQLGRSARIKTYSNDAQTTDSAPSMAAYTTGVKMNNEVISMSANTSAYNGTTPYVNGADSTCPLTGNGTSVPTILEQAKAAGKAVGVVSTARITHATPAATYAHICHRDGENDIAAQLVQNTGLTGNSAYNTALVGGVDVLLGGGRRHFLPSTTTGSKRTDTKDLITQMQSNGYTYVADENGLKAVNTATTSKLLGLFTSSHMSWELDRNPANEPSLTEMTTTALNILTKNNKGFYLMVEGGRIDHALHDTSAKRALVDTIAMDDAVKAAIDLMQQKDPGLKNTLIVVTADHDHTMAFNGYGKRTGPTTGTEAGVLGVVKNVISGTPQAANDGNPYPVLVFGNGNTGATPEAGGSTCAAGGGGTGTASCASVRGVDRGAVTDAQIASDNYHQPVNVPFTGAGSETHGGGDVFLYAGGAGASSFKGTMVNTKVYQLIKTAFGF